MNSKSIMRVRKNRDNPFVMMDKRIFANTSLSWKAKGILGYLLSKPDDWVIRISDLIKQSTDGRDAVYSGVKELRKAGYVELVDVRNESGKIISWEYLVYEEPQNPTEPEPTTSGKSVSGCQTTSGKSRSGFSISGKPDTTNNDLSNNDLTNTNHLVINNTKKRENLFTGEDLSAREKLSLRATAFRNYSMEAKNEQLHKQRSSTDIGLHDKICNRALCSGEVSRSKTEHQWQVGHSARSSSCGSCGKGNINGNIAK